MIRFAAGDIFAQSAVALVNPVNCVGVMGRGLAVQFRRRFPDAFEPYRQACRDRALRPGRVLVWPTRRPAPRWIVHFPTKRHWRDPSRLEDIDAGLRDLAAAVRRHRMPSVAVPPLGCGLGGLDWASVRPLLEAHLADLPCAVIALRPVPARRDPGSPGRAPLRPRTPDSRAFLDTLPE